MKEKIPYFNKLKVGEVKKTMKKKIEELKEHQLVVDGIIEALESQDGKKLTARFLTLIEQALPDWYFYWKKGPCSFSDVCLQCYKHSMNDSLYLYLLANQDGKFLFDKTKESLEKLDFEVKAKELENRISKVPEVVKKYNSAVDIMNECYQIAFYKSERQNDYDSLYPLDIVFNPMTKG